MALPLRPRRHTNTMPGQLVTIEEATHVDIPATEEEWARVSKLKKIDTNDLAHDLGPKGFLKWLDEGATYVVKWPTSGDDIVSLGGLVQSYPDLRRPIIHGLLRETEILNLIAPPKAGKSFLGSNIAMNIIGGGNLFSAFKCERGRVLMIDDEIHPETIVDRNKMIAPAMNVPLDRACRLIDYMPLRGQLIDIYQLEQKIEKIKYRTYSVIVLDALYKLYPSQGFDESSNSDMAHLYTVLDTYAEYTGAAIVVIHHSSKGNQSGKGVTDIGAGAGAMSRACDAHLVLREHKDRGIFSIDSVNRSFPPIQPFCARFKFPVWEAAPDADPEALAGLPDEKGKKVGRWNKNAASASGTEVSSQPVSCDQDEKAAAATLAVKPHDHGQDKVQLSSEERETARLRDFCIGISNPTTVTDILELGKPFKFRQFSSRDSFIRRLLPELLSRGLLTLVAEAVGSRAATYRHIPATTPTSAPQAVVDEPSGISDDEAYGPDTYAHDDDDPPAYSSPE